MARTKLATDRVARGFENDIAFELGRYLSEGKSLTDSAINILLDAGINRYSDKLTAMLRRGGVEIEDGEKIDAETVGKLLSRGLDYDLDDLSEGGVISAVDTEVSRRVSEVIGFEVASVLDAEALASELEAAIVERVGAGGASGLVSAKLLKRLKDAATWSRAGYDDFDRRRVLMSVAQRRYRQSNRMVWD